MKKAECNAEFRTEHAYFHSVILLKNVWKSFGQATVLKDITLRIDPGELVCITGRSGAGKSTLLHLMTGAENISKGGIEVDGVDLRQIPSPVMQLYRRRIGVVFQDYKLIPGMTVAENVAFPLEVCGVSDPEIALRVGTLLKELELSKLAASLPRALSGGEKARTAIARAIVHRPMVLLADEPTGNLDPEASKQVMKIFRDIHKHGTTVIVATHDVTLVEALRARRVHLEDGRIASDTRHHRGQGDEHHVLEEKYGGGNGKRKVKVTSIS
jgi:cell division transport system ATP-binding protein